MEKKYKLTDETIEFYGTKLYRIEALRDFSNVKKGDKGGFVKSEINLSHNGNCWVYDDAKVYDDATVCGNARVLDNVEVYGNAEILDNAFIFNNAKVYDKAGVFNNAKVYGNAKVFDDVDVCGNAKVYDNAEVSGYTRICGDAEIKNDIDYIVFKNFWSSGRYFTWTRSNNKWSVGCFYGTGKELIEKAYKDSELSGKEYERVVNYVETMLKENQPIWKRNTN